MAHPQQGDTRVGDDGVHWVFDGGIWRGDHDMYKWCPVAMNDDGNVFQYFPAASGWRQYRWADADRSWGDFYATDDDEE